VLETPHVSLAGQVAIVTGASRGLGRHVAIALAGAGARVALAARSVGELDAVRDEIGEGRAIAAPTDVRDRAALARLVARTEAELGPVDVLVNNAGLGWYKPFVEWTADEIDLTLDVNLGATLHLTHLVLPGMLERRRGQIVNVASDLARRVLPNMAAYVAAKHGVLGFAGSLLREVKGHGVKVVTLTPGIIDTFFNGGREGTRDETWAMSPAFVAATILHLLTLPEHWVLDEVSMHPLQQDF
jgi:NADP-dependent 3-hydroxy acid dehydrogenase YdfG